MSQPLTPDQMQALDRYEAEEREYALWEMAECKECGDDFPAEEPDYMSYLCPSCRYRHFPTRD